MHVRLCRPPSYIQWQSRTEHQLEAIWLAAAAYSIKTLRRIYIRDGHGFFNPQIPNSLSIVCLIFLLNTHSQFLNI